MILNFLEEDLLMQYQLFSVLNMPIVQVTGSISLFEKESESLYRSGKVFQPGYFDKLLTQLLKCSLQLFRQGYNLVPKTTFLACINFIHKRRNLKFKDDSE